MARTASHVVTSMMGEGLRAALRPVLMAVGALGDAFPGAEDMGNMFQFKRDFQEVFCGPRDPSIARGLNPALQTFEAWLAENKHRIPLT